MNKALASRCLKLVTVFIPKLKLSLEPLFPEKQKRLLNDLDRVLHVNFISFKLIKCFNTYNNNYYYYR